MKDFPGFPEGLLAVSTFRPPPPEPEYPTGPVPVITKSTGYVPPTFYAPRTYIIYESPVYLWHYEWAKMWWYVGNYASESV